MRLRIDGQACVGHARCYALAPDIVKADSRGRGYIDAAHADAPDDIARKIIDSCPERAVVARDAKPDSGEA